mgnify:CR=1 FL=1
MRAIGRSRHAVERRVEREHVVAADAGEVGRFAQVHLLAGVHDAEIRLVGDGLELQAVGGRVGHDAAVGGDERNLVQLDQLTHRVQPEQLPLRLSHQHQILNQQSEDLHRQMLRLLQQRRDQLAQHAQLLQSLFPRRVLQRGYAFCRDSRGQILRRAEGVEVGERVEIHLDDGQLDCQVLQARSAVEPGRNAAL